MQRVIELLDKKVETLFNRQDFEYLLERYMGYEAVQYFRDMIEEIEEQGVLEEQESDLVRSALEFDEITVDEILIPRVNVVAIERNEDFNKIKELFLTEMYSRLPVYEKTLIIL